MFITPPPAEYEDSRVFFGETGSVSSIDLVEGGNRHDSANSLNFESTRRPESYFIDSTSESDSGFTITVKRNTNQPNQPPNQPFSKKRRLAEAAALETSMEESFMNEHPEKKKKKTKTIKTAAKKTSWTCHVCGSGGPEARARCTCGKYIHKDCKTYGVCSI